MDYEVIVEMCNFYFCMVSVFYLEERLWEIIYNNWVVEIFWFLFSFFLFNFLNDEFWVRIFNKICLEVIEKVEDVKFYKIYDVYDCII